MTEEAAEASRQAFYNLKVEETDIRLAEKLAEICRDYCKKTWMEALNLAKRVFTILLIFARFQLPFHLPLLLPQNPLSSP